MRMMRTLSEASLPRASRDSIKQNITGSMSARDRERQPDAAEVALSESDPGTPISTYYSFRERQRMASIHSQGSDQFTVASMDDGAPTSQRKVGI